MHLEALYIIVGNLVQAREVTSYNFAACPDSSTSNSVVHKRNVSRKA